METFSLPRSNFTRAALAAFGGVLALTSLADAAQPSRLRQVAARSVRTPDVTAPLATDTVRPAERSFLETALGASRLQARLADLGSSQAANSDVRSHSEQLKSDHRQLLDALTALIQRKSVVVEAPREPTSDVYTRLAEASGANFDREFVRVMAPLHNETISLFEQAAADSKDPDVRDFAAAQLPMLRAHRNRIAELKRTFD